MHSSKTLDRQVKFSVSTSVTSGAKELIWDVFFASRQRGVDLPAHFPWIDQDRGTYCLTLSLRDSGHVLATLVLRIPDLPLGSRHAMIGMVCVEEAWRGQRLSSQLLSNAITIALNQSVDSLVLWTTQPSIYSSHGFKPDSEVCDTFGQVTLNNSILCSQLKFTKETTGIERGLPPFGHRLIQFKSDWAQVIVVETTSSLSIAEFTGTPTAVLDLIESVLPITHTLNAPLGSPIFDEIKRRGHSYTPLPCATRMVNHLGLGQPVLIPYISILERI